MAAAKKVSNDTKVRRVRKLIKDQRKAEDSQRASATNRSTGERHVLKARSITLELVEDELRSS